MTEDTNPWHSIAYVRFLKHLRPFARSLAYASEGGEVVRHHRPKWVKPLYGISIGYVAVDTFMDVKKQQGLRNRMIVGTDKSIWHGMASLAFPGLAIHQTIKYSRMGLAKTALSASAKRFAPPLIGLATIPFIIHPIDNLADKIMDNTFRKFFVPKEE